ncbi:MAG TPA: YhfC family intramembrane metalloprotease, partial [Firmicutes bacterium]|nr:YhfC family intramembrane metalloprotease [Bacillota bacterium]
MISMNAIYGMIFSLIISLVLPLGLIVWVRRKYKASLFSFFVGMVAWFVAVQVLEAPIHYYLLVGNESTAQFLSQPIAYMLYGGLMAGLFEETARLICFKFILKKQNRIQDSIAYGIGHGGIEAMLLVSLTYLSNLVFSFLINNGTLSSLGMPAELTDVLQSQLMTTDASLFWVAGIERIGAIVVHIGLSVLVFKAVKSRRYGYYLLAILLHAALNFPAALAQLG